MSTKLDVYRDWLGIKEPERPLSYYQLLRLRQFEDDASKIREHYRKMNAHVRKFAAGDFARQSQDLLNELAKAMLCLTDTQRKAEYDASLGRKAAADDGRKRSLEELLLRRNVVDQEKLTRARSYASAVGLEMRDALIQQKIAPADVVIPTYAESIGLPYLDLAEFAIDTSVMNKVPAYVARQHSLTPVMIDDNQLLVAASQPIDPQVEDEIRLRAGLPVRTVICTPAALHEIVNRHYTKELAASELASSAVARPAAQAKSKDASGQSADAPVTADEFEERKTRRRNMTIVGFNFGVMLAMVLMSLLTTFSMLMSLPIAIVVGAIGAAIAWNVAK
jgi:hypothetical protein